MRTDTQLLRQYVRSDNNAAFGEIVSRHGPMVYRVCLHLLRDQHDAEDAAQATFVVLARKARSLHRRSGLAAWLHEVARRTALRALRERSSRTHHEEKGSMLNSADDNTGIEDLERTGALDAVEREMVSLSPRQRQAVVLRYLEGHSEAEAAEIAGCAQGTLGWHASKGLARLRQRLSRRGFALDAGVLTAVLAAEARTTLPPAFLASVTAAIKTTAGGAAAGHAAALAHGVIKAMFWAKVKVATVVLAAATAGALVTPAIVEAVGPEEPSGAAAPPPGAAAEHVAPPVEAKETPPKAEPSPRLARILATELNVRFRRDEVDHVMTELYRQTGLVSGYPNFRASFHVTQPLYCLKTASFTLERKGVTVREILEKLAAKTGLTLEVRRETVVLWHMLDAPRLAALKAQLSSKDTQKRCEAVWELGCSGDPRGLALIHESLFEQDPAVVFWAQNCIRPGWPRPGRRRLPQFVPASQQTLRKLQEKHHGATTAKERLTWLSILCGLGAREAIPAVKRELEKALKETLEKKTRPEEELEHFYELAYCAESLPVPELLPAIMKWWKSGNGQLRGQSLWLLLQYEGPLATGTFRKALGDAEIQGRAVYCLRDRRDAGELLTEIAPIMKDGEHYTIQRNAAEIIAWESRHNPEAFEFLVKSDAPYAVYGLGQTWNPKAFDLIVPHLKEGGPEDRGLALRALGYLRDERSLKILVKSLSDPEDRVRRGAVFALGLLADERGIAPLLGKNQRLEFGSAAPGWRRPGDDRGDQGHGRGQDHAEGRARSGFGNSRLGASEVHAPQGAVHVRRGAVPQRKGRATPVAAVVSGGTQASPSGSAGSEGTAFRRSRRP